ncbi:hypothetical protein Vadar_009825 [Vaccinium darrowii]|uniref:Uncharacterized protein n=1 Tax=Vaccinium darrowii TaxID=229202 RepID=A0ACB7XGC7_9ERIC|nr:hypothetical protein Vadar_009825 [Vaccinium darrowii]
MVTIASLMLLLTTWDLRGVILVSLALQIFLILFAPLRKRVSTAKITGFIWLAYLLADSAATYGVGLISKGFIISKSQGDTYGPFASPTLLAFWAPFLLVHLGGPDAITAFALEDNELWKRHLLDLVSQGVAVGYAFFQAFPDHKFWLPTLLMFVAGVIKYSERTHALYLASSDKFKDSLMTEPDPGPDYAKLMDELDPETEGGLQTKREWIPEASRIDKTGINKEDSHELSDLEIVQVAYNYFDTFKGLIADSLFSFRERDRSQHFFLKLKSSREVFKVVEVELNFFYDILYTKAMVLRNTFGCFWRILSFGLNCAAAWFFYSIEKKEIEKVDIRISYTLLLGAIALDLMAFAVVLYSDWIVVALTTSHHRNRFIRIMANLLNIKRERWPKNPENKPRCFIFGKIMQIVRFRWSESLSTYNFINYCLHPRAKWLKATTGIFGLNNLLDEMVHVKTVDFPHDLRDLIFEELKKKSEKANDLETAKEIFSARGDWILRSEKCSDLIRWINGVEFDESLIMWHIATDLCYYTPRLGETNLGNEDNKNYKEMSKLLSDYLLYLLTMQSTMLSTVVGIGQIRFRDTCAEAQKFFHGKEIGESQEKACKRILGVKTLVEPSAVRGYRSKSVLFDACILAKELKKLEEQKMWLIISKVWVELMCYAASHCRANNHMAQLSKGGQLLTLVWLLMAHLGIGDRFQISEGHARANVIVRK